MASTGEDFAIWLANYVIVDGKMRTLFSMLFGASMLLVIERAKAAGRSPARVHYARMAVLLLFGLLHFYLIWHGDILVLYALTGMVAYLFRNRATKTMLIWATCLMLATTHHVQRRELRDAPARSRRARRERVRQRRRAVERHGVLRDQARRPRMPQETRLALGRVGERAAHMVTERGAEPFTSFARVRLADARR